MNKVPKTEDSCACEAPRPQVESDQTTLARLLYKALGHGDRCHEQMLSNERVRIGYEMQCTGRSSMGYQSFM